jgi:hypothetical protein
MSKKIIPFSLYPYSWGLTGKARERAKAEYELTGLVLEKKLLELSKDEMDEDTYYRKHLDLELKRGVIDKSGYDHALVAMIKDKSEREQALIDLQKQEGSITELEYAKSSATLKGEPWVTVLSMDFGGKKSLEGSFELDWNELFVESLKKEGYEGLTADSIVNQWFMEVCRNVALEEFDGTGNFSADSEANLETVKRWNSESIGNNRKGHS